jgi:hypothetical protein
MSRFNLEVNPVISHATLLEQAVGLGPVPQAYLCCVQRQHQTRVFCLHLPTKYTSSLDGRMTPWDGVTFAYLGEAIQGQVTTVILPEQAFRPIYNVRARTTDYIINHLNDLGAYGLPYPDANDQDTIETSVRAMIYLPARYVPLVLNPSGYNLRQLWETLYPAMVDADDLEACSPLIKWMRVVSTSMIQNNLPGPTSATVELQVPLADEDLIIHRQRLQRLVLPSLYRPQESFERAITQMAVAVTQSTNETRAAREEKAARQAEPKLPSDRFTVTLHILQSYLQIEDERHLPLLWHRLANSTKKQDFHVLSDLLQAYARGPEKFTTCAPIATAKLMQDLINFVFVSESTNDIKSGLQPFVIANATAEHRQANMEIARMYGMLTAGDTSLQLTDLEALQSKEAQSVPLSYFELERNLGMFGNLLGTVLGSNHVLTTRYREFWTLLSQGYRQELQQIIDNKRYIKPAHVLRSIQLVCYN